MKLSIPAKYLVALKKLGSENPIIQGATHRQQDELLKINSSCLNDDELDAIVKQAKAELNPNNPNHVIAAKLLKKIELFTKIINGGGKTMPIKKLDMLEPAMRVFLGDVPNHWVFKPDENGHMLPYFVESIVHDMGSKGMGYTTPPHVRIQLEYSQLGKNEKDHINVYLPELKGGKTPAELLSKHDIVPASKELIEEYQKDIARFNIEVQSTGKQHLGVGLAMPTEGYNISPIALEQDNEPAKLIMDELFQREDGKERGGDYTGIASNEYWDVDRNTDSENAEPGQVVLPVHPVARMFDLGRHTFLDVHISSLKPYTYQKDLEKKLVLDDDYKEIIRTLILHAGETYEDIIRGKTGGTFIMCTGPAGVGKTLSAEIYSETIERPLYIVQCAELGIQLDKIEANLQIVLDRALRWGAIPLIDESDVYVRDRGADIVQNAIVGIFLRLIERYRGILFMTSNRETVIDDAILSRAMAHIRYKLPDNEDQKEIWRILSQNYEIQLSKKTIEEINERVSSLSGRNIKNLLKLAKVYATKKQPVTPELITKLAKFIDTPEGEDLITKTTTN